MTTRGKPADIRPITHPDPTLATHPVSRRRYFAIQSFVRKLLRDVNDWEAVIFRDDIEFVEPNPTWEFYVFLAAYSNSAQARLSQAIKFLITATHRCLQRTTLPIYANEAVKRFKLDVIQDEAALSNGSDDRVREEFRAYIRGLHITDDEEAIPPPARNAACLVLDEETITILTGLSFLENPLEDFKAIGEETTIKVIDSTWQRPEGCVESSYRGVGRCTVTQLAGLYTLLVGGILMEDLHPMNGCP